MSRFRLFCALGATLFIMAPSASFAQAQAWIDLAAAAWNAPDGSAKVAAGYSGVQPTGAAATQAAMQNCQSGGGQGCKNLGPFNAGCAFIIWGSDSAGDVAWWAEATSDATLTDCKKAGYTCQPPIGGCVSGH